MSTFFFTSMSIIPFQTFDWLAKLHDHQCVPLDIARTVRWVEERCTNRDGLKLIANQDCRQNKIPERQICSIGELRSAGLKASPRSARTAKLNQSRWSSTSNRTLPDPRNADQPSDIRHGCRVNVSQRQPTQTHQEARICCQESPSGNNG